MVTFLQSTDRPKPMADVGIIATGLLHRVGKTMAFGKVLEATEDGTATMKPCRFPSFRPTRRRNTSRIDFSWMQIGLLSS